ncbi:hypothetical protein [Halomicrococcus sp. SG-WS-1]|uniref:hypothetical protein n=1 Tax=Halomicrococcus sp. SG-WS-1 TaxID=3439057 RepID=UPI003F791E7E
MIEVGADGTVGQSTPVFSVRPAHGTCHRGPPFRIIDHRTMTHPNARVDDGTPPTGERTKALEHIVDALDADEMDETNYHLREALQLLTIEEHSRERPLEEDGVASGETSP